MLRVGVSLMRTYSLNCLLKNCGSSLQQRETLPKSTPNSQYILTLLIVHRYFDITSVFIFSLRSQLLLNYSSVWGEIKVIDPEIRNFLRFMVNSQYDAI